jgi:beta-glucosidase-like glycosyl hydrolase
MAYMERRVRAQANHLIALRESEAEESRRVAHLETVNRTLSTRWAPGEGDHVRRNAKKELARERASAGLHIFRGHGGVVPRSRRRAARASTAAPREERGAGRSGSAL